MIRRGALAHLLIHANSVVATSKLLATVWPGDTPLTARKMLQNAVRDLRRVLSSETGTDSGASGRAVLLTEAHGYRLRIDPDAIDLFRFRQAAERGRADVAAGSYESAARVLREALGLWRGTALADLVEEGLAWPELTVLENGRLNALEDLFEAELACGRHHAVLGELQSVAAAEPTRERLSCQLMLALYRCGRQTDALAAYRHIRVELAERYGLEPTRKIQKLQRAILDHDPELEVPSRPALIDVTALPGPDSVRRPPAQARPGLTAVHPPHPRPRGRNDLTVERQRVSLLLAWARYAPDGRGHGAADLQAAQRECETLVREVSEQFGGTMNHAGGPVFSTLFGYPEPYEDDAARAVRAAHAMRDRFNHRGPGRPARPLAHRTCLHIAVVTGDAYLSFRPDDDIVPEVVGEVVDRCFRLLVLAPRGQVRVCDLTRRASERTPARRVGPESPEGWEPSRGRSNLRGMEEHRRTGTLDWAPTERDELTASAAL
ncbi:BTAD domain-containing putative transcriptional regulator [Streptomyces sp. NPDC059101]|uniref:AfsR/SARP family transcriptional regulator n=1 Tax=Streptomyces sp. NPDC059101 TaxID=3346728 RepID=UPI0036B3F12F